MIDAQLAPLEQDNVDFKTILVKKVLANPKYFEEGEFDFQVNYHDVPLKISTGSEVIQRALNEYIPDRWKHQGSSTLLKHITWIDPENIDASYLNYWQDQYSADCKECIISHLSCVIHRDFVAVNVSENHWALLAPYSLSDGFFNFMRWLLPPIFLKKHKLVLHSSCVLSDDLKYCYLFLGHSGAGKTTTTKFFNKEKVLGDDMNILTFKQGSFFCEPALMGQKITNSELFGQRFKLKGVYWLNKSDQNYIGKEPEGAMLKLLASCAQLNWKKLRESEREIVFKMVSTLYKVLGLKRLDVFKGGGVSELISKKA